MGSFLDSKKEELAQLMQYYKELVNETNQIAVDEYKKRMSKADDELAKEKDRRNKESIDELMRLQKEGYFKLEDDHQKYAELKNKEEANDKLKRDLQNAEKLAKARSKSGQKALDRQNANLQKKIDRVKEGKSNWRSDFFENKFSEFFKAWQEGELIKKSFEENIKTSLNKIGENITAGLNQINNAISSYAKYQTSINTRLQGSNKNFSSITNKLGSVAYSPLINSQNLYSNLSTLVSEGVVSNIEQRAFLMTVKESIADTFDANSANLRQLIRIQQTDTTAARLGMESYLTKYLNKFVESTEYLSDSFKQVSSSLLEASSLLSDTFGADASTEFEYQVQKWLGLLEGAGVSSSTVQSIGTALGQLGSGDINSLSGSNMQNLLVMAASKAGLSYSDMLSNGITANTANSLLYGLTEYLQEIGNSGNNVVRNQLADIFGVSVSDLVAVKNLSSSDLTSALSNSLSTSGMYNELASALSTSASRQGMANLLENAYDNYTYQTGMDIASNPATFAMWKIADLIESTTGGINIPAITALGNGIDLNATVTQLMKLGIVGYSTLGNISSLVDGVTSVFNGNGSNLLDLIGITSGSSVITTGSGLTGRTAGLTTSQRSYLSTSDSSAFTESAISDASESAQRELDQKTAEDVDEVLAYLQSNDADSGIVKMVSDIQTDIHDIRQGTASINVVGMDQMISGLA